MEDLQESDKNTNSISSLAGFDMIAQDATFGTCLISKRDTQQTYTMKRFKITPSHTWPLELSVLEMINDREAPFLPQIRWRLYEESSFSLIMNSYPGGNLRDYIEANGPLSLPHALLYASELVEALSVIHAAGIQHRNITPSNLTIDGDGHIVLIGFEHAYVENDSDRSQYSSARESVSFALSSQHEYRAPEVLLGWTHDYAVDCWGFGCVLYFMLYGEHPFPLDGVGVIERKERIIRGRIYHDGTELQIPPRARDLIRSCMEPNPAFRLDVAEIKNHAFFACVNWSLVHEKNIEAPYVPGPILHKAPTKGLDSDEKTIRQSTSTASLAAPSDSPSGWVLQTPTPPYTLTTPSMFSLKAREEVQEMLPTIFRISNDGPRPPRSRTSTVQSACSSEAEDDYALPSPAPTYDSLRRRLDSISLTPEERLARFWESLDQDLKTKSSDTGRYSIGDLPYLHRPLAIARKSRNKATTNSPLASRLSLSNLTASTQRFSQFIKPTTPSSALLRKHKSSPSLVPIKESLPKDVEQIGNGIGFTYRTPAHPVPLPVSTPVNEMMARSRLKRQISGLKLGGSRVLKWGNALWTRKGERPVYGGGGENMGMWREKETVGDVYVGRASSSTRAGMGIDTDDVPQVSDGDVFRYGMLPKVRDAGIVSPVTETDSTVNNSPYPDSELPIQDPELARQISGLKLGGSRVLKWGNALWTRKGERPVNGGGGENMGMWREETVGDVYVGRASSSTRAGMGIDTDDVPQVSDGDVFRYGMLPKVRDAGIVSPVTETDSTVNNSPYPDSELPIQGAQGSGTLTELMREGGGRRMTLRLVL
ncbi:hypothetical protein PQX77_012118 [Marasmius sp. AFHP31]|nr:hypothetical protein PQX77_012118 [Marasmius sp. AFHP31]